jgi:hypothetical protein
VFTAPTDLPDDPATLQLILRAAPATRGQRRNFATEPWEERRSDDRSIDDRVGIF